MHKKKIKVIYNRNANKMTPRYHLPLADWHKFRNLVTHLAGNVWANKQSCCRETIVCITYMGKNLQ